MTRKNHIQYTLFVIVLLVLTSCSKPKETATNCSALSQDKIVFFSLKSYFCDLTSTYQSEGVKVNKRVSFGNNSEVIENMEIDWNAEFATFINADINHSSWIDKFNVDTLKNNLGYSVQYLSNTPSIPVKKVIVDFNQDESVKQINIETERRNILYKSKQTIEFIPNQKYTVEGYQRTLFLSKITFKVESNILATSN